MQALSCSFCHICSLRFLFPLALPSVFNNSKIIIFNFRWNKMPQVLIHASLLSSSALSVLNMDHCLTLHPFSLGTLVFWHDLIHLIGLEIMATVWFLSKPTLQGKLPEFMHPNLDPGNIAMTTSSVSKLWTSFQFGTAHFQCNGNTTLLLPYIVQMEIPSFAGEQQTQFILFFMWHNQLLLLSDCHQPVPNNIFY